MRLHPFDELRLHGSIPHRHDPVDGALEDGEMLRFPGDARNSLHAGGSRADHAYFLACEVHTVRRPSSREEELAGKVVQAGNIRALDFREAARSRDDEIGRDGVAAVGLNSPATLRFVERGARNGRVETDVRPKREAVRDVAEI